MFRLLFDRELYETVILKEAVKAKRFLWLGTSDIKDLYVNKSGRMVPFLEIISDLIKRKVEVRFLYAKEPGPNFRKDYDKYPILAKGMEQMQCPRVHFKTVIVDGQVAYSGSANLTGAGLGAKSPAKRNFETGFITNNEEIVDALMQQYDQVWMGMKCKTCQRKEFCIENM
ncbi:MAG: phospholipase [Marinilabiliales bacterium]|nr:MAG: phospholipase [Marinilabiliales bacterium]